MNSSNFSNFSDPNKKHNLLPHVTRVCNLNTNNSEHAFGVGTVSRQVKPCRGGIILYTVYNNILYFGLAIDNKTHDLTDAGGSIDYITDKTAVRGCIREFSEETLDIFESLTEDQLQQCPVVYDEKNMIIFMRIEADPNEVSRRLTERYKIIMDRRSKDAKYRGRKLPEIPEVCGITWITRKTFEESLAVPGVIYSRVRKFLSRAETLYELL